MRRGVVCGLLAVVFAAAVGHANPYDGRLLTLKDLKKEARANEELDKYMARNGLPDVAESRVLADRPPWDGHQVTLYYLGTRKEISFARAMVLGKADISITRYERDLTDADVAALVGILDTAAIEPDTAPNVERVAYVDSTDAVVTEPMVAQPVSETDAGEDDVIEMAALDEDAAIDDMLEFDMTNPADRAEAAALRAEQAADRVEEAADKTEAAALRAEKAFDRLAAAVEAKRTKRKR
jgi:hypothetical protein